MKPGFKPTLWTKKEWQDNRAPACKGCGVGEALDQLQPHRNKPISGMTAEDLSKANAVLGKLQVALQKAEGKCGPNQKDTKAGIGEYKKAVGEFEKKLKAATEMQIKRTNILKAQPLRTLDEAYTKINSDADYKAALIAFAKTALLADPLDAWILWKEKKFTDMVRKYGPKNDYNLSDKVNNVLVEVFVSKKNLTPDLVKAASQVLNGGVPPGGGQTIASSFQEMIVNGVFPRFHKSDLFMKYLFKKLPIADFKM
jgi:hypothetical protein